MVSSFVLFMSSLDVLPGTGDEDGVSSGLSLVWFALTGASANTTGLTKAESQVHRYSTTNSFSGSIMACRGGITKVEVVCNNG